MTAKAEPHAIADDQSGGAMRHDAKTFVEIDKENIVGNERREIRGRRAAYPRGRIDSAAALEGRRALDRTVAPQASRDLGARSARERISCALRR